MDEPFLPPSLRDRFVDARQLGEGAFGTVVYARDANAGGRPVAVKLLKTQEDPTGSWRARFEREAQLTEALESHYVVRSYGHGVADGVPYLILEYIEGPTLEDRRIGAGGKLPVDEALRRFVEVLFGLRAAHGQGVLHRDLKPENVLLRFGEEAVLTDFGLARDVASETLTATGTVMGTLLYMAPEMLSGQPATARSDVYAAVCMFGELVLGEVPLGGTNVGEIYDRRERGGFVGFRAEGVPIPLRVDKLLAQALDPNPAKRPVSAWEMSETLVEALETEQMQDLLAKVTLDGVSRTQPPVVLDEPQVDLDAPTMDDLAAPPGGAVTSESSAHLRRSAFVPAPPAPPPTPEAGQGGVGVYALAAAFVVLLGLSFGLGGGEAPEVAPAPAVEGDPAEVRHQEAALVARAYLARLEPPRRPGEPTVLERFLELDPDTAPEQSQGARDDAERRLDESFEEVRRGLAGLDLARGDAPLLATVARLRSLELLVHVTGPVELRGARLESFWGRQLARVVAAWALPVVPHAGQVLEEGGRRWRPIWSGSLDRQRMAESWAGEGVMRSWEQSRGRPEVRGQTLGRREFVYAGDKIQPMVDVFVPDRTLWVDYWPYAEVAVEPELTGGEPGPRDLVLALALDDVPWSFVPHLELIGEERTLRVPVRPAYSPEKRTDMKRRGMGKVPTGVRVAGAVLPRGLHHVRVLNVGVEPLGNTTNQFRLEEIYRLESGALPPEAAFAAALTQEDP